MYKLDGEVIPKILSCYLLLFKIRVVGISEILYFEHIAGEL